MREILFRGKSEVSREWVYGYYFKAKYYRTDRELYDYISIPHPETHNAPSDHILVVSGTVGQYTGLKDKNGKKIFEDDIVRYEDAEADFEGYHDRNFMNRGTVLLTPWGGINFTNRQTVEMDDLYNSETSIAAEIIGNIHDDPVLEVG